MTEILLDYVPDPIRPTVAPFIITEGNNIVLRAPHIDTDPAHNNNWLIRVASRVGAYVTVIRLLQDKRVDPTADNNYAIRHAAQNGHLDIVKLLLQDKRVDPAAMDNYPIWIAAHMGHKHVVEFLLQDSRVNPADGNNKVIRMAAYQRWPEIVALLCRVPRVRAAGLPTPDLVAQTLLARILGQIVEWNVTTPRTLVHYFSRAKSALTEYQLVREIMSYDKRFIK